MKARSIISAVFFMLVISLAVVPAYPWSSYNGGTHVLIDNAAYDRLCEVDGFNPANFPSRDSIAGYEGWIYGPDAVLHAFYEKYKYSNHYYNPDTGEGYAPQRAKYWFEILNREIKKGNARESKEAAKAAAYLAHYVADAGVPYHVSTKGHLIKNPWPAYKDWNDPDYIEKAGLVPTGPHPEWEKEAMSYSYNDCTKYPGISEEWLNYVGAEGKSQIEEFVKAVAARTNRAAGSDARDLIGHSIQDVYTVYLAAYEYVLPTPGSAGQAESSESEILAAARSYVQGNSAPGQQFYLKLSNTVNDKYALVEVIPQPPGSCEGAGVVLEKINGQWKAVEMGTDLSKWDEKVPGLFNF